MSGQGNGVAHRLQVEEIQPRQTGYTQPMMEPTMTSSTVPQTEKKPDTSYLSAISGAFSAIAMLLSVRLLLILSITGAFTLGEAAISVQSTYSLITLGIFCAFTMPFLTYLDIQTRRR